MIKVVVYAENIKIGGGLVLLQSLANHLPNKSTLYFANEQIKNNFSPSNVKFVSDNIKNRLLGRLSFDLADACHLHFGNLPPIYSKSRKIYIYIHNSLLLESWSQIKEENFKLKLRLILERMFMRIFIRKFHTLIVQTRYMERLVNKVFPKNFVKLVKFADTTVSNIPGKFKSKTARLIYIGGKEKFKNFENVIHAVTNFCKKFDINITMLIIGIDEAFSNEKIDRSVSNLKLIFKTNIEREEVLRDIKKSNLLIFASETESFGLPLLEASGYGVDIIAADADYVLETCRPKFLFNPKEPESLIRALTLYFELNDFPNLINVCDLKEILFQ